MNKDKPQSIRFHEDSDLFVESLNFTATETAFLPRLIEKDYFCSVLLEYLMTDDTLVFKGGTCLTKAYLGFYRLSEDLDFVIPTPIDATRTQRSHLAAGIKRAFNAITDVLPVFRIAQPMTGSNNSTQYIGIVTYTSPYSSQQDTIKIEVGLREPLLLPKTAAACATILLDPVSRQPMVQAVKAGCIDRQEAYAEKYRAALSRREAAIRDFFDIDYAIQNNDLNPEDKNLILMVREKLAIPGNEPANISNERKQSLQRQLDTQLKPVLRNKDFRNFDLERAFHAAERMVERLN